MLVGYAAALGAAMCYGSTTLIGRKIVTEVAPPLVASAFSLLLGMLIVGAMFWGHLRQDAARAPARAWVWMGLAGLAASWGVTSNLLALSQGPVVLVAPVGGTNPLFTIVLTHVLLRGVERVTWRTAVGAALVVGGAAAVAIGGA